MNVSITKIRIDNLSVDYAIPLVAEALGMDDDDSKVKSLAETIHRKTEGNPFFMLMFLRSLYDEKLLKYNFGVVKWTWDEDACHRMLFHRVYFMFHVTRQPIQDGYLVSSHEYVVDDINSKDLLCHV